MFLGLGRFSEIDIPATHKGLANRSKPRSNSTLQESSAFVNWCKARKRTANWLIAHISFTLAAKSDEHHLEHCISA